MTDLIANGIRLHARIDGSAGPWIVLSNSLGCTLEMWDAQVEALRGRYRILRYDTRGHGRSETVPGPYSMEMLADDLLGLMDAAGVERTFLAGLSMGGMLAQVAALKAPERFLGLVLADTTSRYGPEVAEFWAGRARTALTEGLEPISRGTPARWFTPGFVERHPQIVERYREMLLSNNPVGYAGCCAAIPRIDVTDRLGQLSLPACVIVGEQDPSTTPAHARRIAEALPGAELVILPDAAHLSNVEQPEAFGDVLTRFLAHHTPATPDVPVARLALPDGEAMSDEQREVCAEATAGLRGRVPAPMQAWIRSPEMARRAQKLGEILRYQTSLPPDLSELAILLTARHWTSHYEWMVHKREGLRAGIDPAVIDAIARHEAPPLRTAPERTVHAVTKSLLETHEVTDGLYAEAVGVLGERGVVELVGILGYYTLVSMTLNAFRIGLPEAFSPELT
ncbi:MAG: 3-oxoadipate enol-lactonase [Azospirillum brasilense]|nr:MAG: 3-oxoadipate enol-lactonase [Azospirillum brasilense]